MEDKILEAIKTQPTMRKAAKSLGMPFTSFKRRAEKLGVYNPNQGRRGVLRGAEPWKRTPTTEILEGKHPQFTTARLKRRLVEEGIMEDICVDCGLTNTWNGKPIVLHLDHINGVSNDHRLENLRILCPNCHSQTPTWCGRGKRK